MLFVVYYVTLVGLSIALLLFNMYHLMLVFNNMTTYEYSIYSKTENESKHYYENKHFKYCLDIVSNIKMVLGENILLWVFPYNKTIVEDNLEEVIRDNTNLEGILDKDSKNFTSNNSEVKNIVKENNKIELNSAEISILYKYFKSLNCFSPVFKNGVNFKINELNELEVIKSL